MRNPFYQVASFLNYARAIGWQPALQLRFCDVKVRTGFGQPSHIELKLKNSQFPLLMRTHRSDRDVLRQVFIQKEYEPVELTNPKTIIDLGANVGYSGAYFLTKYPTAKVLAAEPDPDNYAVCCRNLAPYAERAKVIQGAAWPENTKLILDKGTYGDGRDWATRVRAATDDESAPSGDYIEGYDIARLIGACGAAEIDLLKIDIERSELDLFSRNTEGWLPRVKNLCIELHDSECERVFFEAMSCYSYSLRRTEGLVICHDIRTRR